MARWSGSGEGGNLHLAGDLPPPVRVVVEAADYPIPGSVPGLAARHRPQPPGLQVGDFFARSVFGSPAWQPGRRFPHHFRQDAGLFGQLAGVDLPFDPAGHPGEVVGGFLQVPGLTGGVPEVVFFPDGLQPILGGAPGPVDQQLQTASRPNFLMYSSGYLGPGMASALGPCTPASSKQAHRPGWVAVLARSVRSRRR